MRCFLHARFSEILFIRTLCHVMVLKHDRVFKTLGPVFQTSSRAFKVLRENQKLDREFLSDKKSQLPICVITRPPCCPNQSRQCLIFSVTLRMTEHLKNYIAKKKIFSWLCLSSSLSKTRNKIFKFRGQQKNFELNGNPKKRCREITTQFQIVTITTSSSILKWIKKLCK